MSLRSRVASIFRGQRAATTAIEFHPPSSAYFGTGLSNQPDHTTLLQESLGTADTATRAIANRVSTLEPLVKVRKRDVAGTEVDEILDDHVLKRLLDRPHPNFSRAQLFRLTAQWIISTGEGYWLKVDNGFSVPSELHPVPPAMIVPVLQGGVVRSYAVSDGRGRQEQIPADVVIRFYFPDPENPWRSEGYLGPNASNTDAAKFARQHLRRHFQSDATPKSAIELAEGATGFKDDDERSRFWGLWKQRFHNRTGTETGLPMVLPPLWKLIQMGMQTGADITPLLSFYSDDQLMNFGVPRSVLGQVVSGDRSSAETTEWIFDLHTVSPIATLISDTLTLQLAPDFDESIFIEFEEFIAKDKAFDLQREETDLRTKVRSVNQVREDRGLDPVPWGEQPVGAFTDVPYTGESFDEPEAEVEDEEPPVPDEDLDDEEPRQRSFARIQTHEIEQIVAAIDDPQMLKAMSAELRELITALGQSAIAEVGVEQLFSGADPRVTQFLEGHAAQSIERIGDTTKAAIRQALLDGTEAGEGVSGLSTRIGDVFKDARGYRSRTIARTETVAAQTFATETGYGQAGVDAKEWLSSRDGSVRDTHQPVVGLDGEVVPMGDNFTSPDGARGPGPGLMGVAAEDINCRCTLLPVLLQASATLNPEHIREAQWRAKEARRKPWEIRMGRLVRSIFRNQERAVRARLLEADEQVAA